MRKYLIAITVAMSLLSASAEVTYKYDESTKTLTFSGDGEMNVYTTDIFGDTYINPEWSNLKDEVENVVVNEGVTNIGKHAFMSFSKLKDVKIASTVEIIDFAAFEGCTSLAEITLPEGLKEFGEEAFYECSSLTSISIPKNVTFLPKSIFQSCKSLKNIDLGNVRNFGEAVFKYCGFETFVIPEGTKTLSENMFFSCRNIKKLDIPASVDTIESGAFYYCELDTIKFLGETFPLLTGFNNFTMNKEDGDVVISINCNAFTQEAIEAIKSHGGSYDTKIIPAWPYGTDVYSTNNAYGPLTITPVDCDKNLYKLSVDLWTSSYQVTWNGTYKVSEEDKNKPEIIVDLSSPATVIAQIDYVQGGGSSIPTINFSVTKTGMGDVDVEVVEKTSTSHTYKLTATPKEGYEFLYWETYNEGILTEEQAKNPELTLTITATEYIQAFFTQSSYCGKDGGENIAWSIKNDTLYLTGEGEMEDYSLFEVAPYSWSLDDFQYVKVGEGITTLGDMAFVFMDNIKKIYLPSTLSVIGSYAFTECDELENVYFSGMTPPSFEQLEDVFAKSTEDADDVTIVVPCDALDAYKEVLTDMNVICGNSAVDDVDADGIVAVATDGRISVNRDDFRIYDALGRDVTSSSGSLTSGVYIVKCEGQTQKVVVR
ncbi:MAG: leucine-rich repeat protein [Paludibacteraceae bacterium]|nr:leucine-rich repeat protein [Paludibacteraceae bacterium]